MKYRSHILGKVATWDSKGFKSDSDYGVFFLYDGEYPPEDGLPWYTIEFTGTLDECKAEVADSILWGLANNRPEYGTGVIISCMEDPVWDA